MNTNTSPTQTADDSEEFVLGELYLCCVCVIAWLVWMFRSQGFEPLWAFSTAPMGVILAIAYLILLRPFWSIKGLMRPLVAAPTFTLAIMGIASASGQPQHWWTFVGAYGGVLLLNTGRRFYDAAGIDGSKLSTDREKAWNSRAISGLLVTCAAATMAAILNGFKIEVFQTLWTEHGLVLLTPIAFYDRILIVTALTLATAFVWTAPRWYLLVPYGITTAAWVVSLYRAGHPTGALVLGCVAAVVPLVARAPWLLRNIIRPQRRARIERNIQPPGKQSLVGTLAKWGAKDGAAEKMADPNFSHIHGMSELKARLLDAHREIMGAREPGRSPRNGVLLHGGPGNGKTGIVQAFANQVRLPLLTLTGGKIASEWVGEETTRVVAAFSEAKAQAPCILFIDEIDSLLIDRSSKAAQGVAETRKIVNALLTEIVELRDHNVMLIAATNHLKDLDPAGIREGRFDYKVEVGPPDEEARIGLLRDGLKKHVPNLSIEDTEIVGTAKRWRGFSCKRILAVTEEAERWAAEAPRDKITMADLLLCLRRVQGRAGVRVENAKSLADLVLPEIAALQLRSIAARMRNIHEIEMKGGTVPEGVLLAGPPGTGKGETVRALTKETGWALLTTTGHDLIDDASKLDKIYAEASDLRPCIIFIDEGDDILADRSVSGAKIVTNKLLTIMDGVGGKIPDILFITATNHPEVMDSAVLRGGRFTEKVMFELPTRADLERYIPGWFAKKSVALAMPVHDVATALEGSSIANVNAICQMAVNLAIGDSPSEERICVGEAHLRLAIQTIGV